MSREAGTSRSEARTGELYACKQPARDEETKTRTKSDSKKRKQIEEAINDH